MEEQKQPLQNETIAENKSGMSTTTLALLAVLVIVISVIGTWAVVNSVYTVNKESSGVQNTQSAVVSLTIEKPPLKESTSSGEVTLDIKKS